MYEIPQNCILCRRGRGGGRLADEQIKPVLNLDKCAKLKRRKKTHVQIQDVKITQA